MTVTLPADSVRYSPSTAAQVIVLPNEERFSVRLKSENRKAFQAFWNPPSASVIGSLTTAAFDPAWESGITRYIARAPRVEPDQELAPEVERPTIADRGTQLLTVPSIEIPEAATTRA